MPTREKRTCESEAGEERNRERKPGKREAAKRGGHVHDRLPSV
jgi:hypothetical protein